MKMLTLLCDRSPIIAGKARRMAAALAVSGMQALAAHQPERPHRREHGHEHLRVEPRHRADDRRQLGEGPQHDRHDGRVRVLVLPDVNVRPP